MKSILKKLALIACIYSFTPLVVVAQLNGGLPPITSLQLKEQQKNAAEKAQTEKRARAEKIKAEAKETVKAERIKADIPLAEEKKLYEKLIRAPKFDFSKTLEKAIAQPDQKAEKERMAAAEQARKEEEKKARAEKLKAEAEKKAEAERLEAEQEEAERLLAVKKTEAEKKAREEKFRVGQKNIQEDLVARLRSKLEVQENVDSLEEVTVNSKIVDEYKARIAAEIRRNIVMPPDVPYNAVAKFEVTMLPNGRVSSTRLIKPSGIAVYDLAVERAIIKSQPLPFPPDPALFDRFRELHLKASPSSFNMSTLPAISIERRSSWETSVLELQGGIEAGTISISDMSAERIDNQFDVLNKSWHKYRRTMPQSLVSIVESKNIWWSEENKFFIRLYNPGVSNLLGFNFLMSNSSCSNKNMNKNEISIHFDLKSNPLPPFSYGVYSADWPFNYSDIFGSGTKCGTVTMAFTHM